MRLYRITIKLLNFIVTLHKALCIHTPDHYPPYYKQIKLKEIAVRARVFDAPGLIDTESHYATCFVSGGEKYEAVPLPSLFMGLIGII